MISEKAIGTIGKYLAIASVMVMFGIVRGYFVQLGVGTAILDFFAGFALSAMMAVK